MEMNVPVSRIGKYEIIDKIGEGGMAIVYQARDTQLDRVVALKVIKPHFRDITVFQRRFEREKRALRKLGKHPRILSLLDYDEHTEENEKEGALAYLVTDYLPGGSLAQKLKEQDMLGVQEALHISIQLLDALDYAHSKGVIHRDVTPGNILFREDGSLVLSDFGLVSILEDRVENSPTSLTLEQVPGTPPYIAPERFTQREALPQNDLYSVGMVLYRMLAGEKYIELRGNPPQGIRKLNKLVPPDLEQIMLKALARDLKQRYASASVLKADLEVVQRELAGRTIEDTLPPDRWVSPPPEPVNPPPTVYPVPKLIENNGSRSLTGAETIKLSGQFPIKGRRRWYALVALALVVSLILVEVFVKLKNPSPLASTPVVAVTSPSSSIIKIAIDVPSSGIDSSDGKPILAGAEFAIDQANAMGVIPGYKLVAVPKDDTSPAGTADPEKGAGNITAAISDNLTAAIIGPYNSAVAVAEMPITNQAPIAQLSPANTDPCLTRDTPTNLCGGIIPAVRPTGKVNYFRIVATDDAQASLLAQFLRKKGYRSAYIIYNLDDAYSTTYADLFRQAWLNHQGTLVAPMDNEPADAGIGQYASQFEQLNTTPDLVFFAGIMPAAARVKEAMAEVSKLHNTAYAGGAGLKIDSFVQSITQAGATGGPIYAAVPVIDNTQTKQFEINYLNSSPAAPYRPYTATANDCALIIIQALKMVIKSGILPPKNAQDTQGAKRFREAVIQKISHLTVQDIPVTNSLFIATSFQSFDQNGDNTNNYVSIYSFNAITPGTPWQLQESDPAR